MEIDSFRVKIKSHYFLLILFKLYTLFFFRLKNLLYASAQAENKQNFKSTVKTYPGWESVKNDFILPIFFVFCFVCVCVCVCVCVRSINNDKCHKRECKYQRKEKRKKKKKEKKKRKRWKPNKPLIIEKAASLSKITCFNGYGVLEVTLTVWQNEYQRALRKNYIRDFFLLWVMIRAGKATNSTKNEIVCAF